MFWLFSNLWFYLNVKKLFNTIERKIILFERGHYMYVDVKSVELYTDFKNLVEGNPKQLFQETIFWEKKKFIPILAYFKTNYFVSAFWCF